MQAQNRLHLSLVQDAVGKLRSRREPVHSEDWRRQVKIFGIEYEIRYVEDLEDVGFEGTSSSVQRVLRLSKGASYERTASTLVHEIIEIINNHLELELPHHAISCLETGIFDALHSNGISLKPLLKKNK